MMWTCTKCNFANKNEDTVCEKCGAVKSAGRFARSAQLLQSSHTRYLPAAAEIKGGNGFCLWGAIMAVLFPLLLIFLFILFRTELNAAVRDLFFSNIPEQETADYKIRILYWAICVMVSMLSSLPGIWTFGIGKILRRLSRMERRL